jgi:succinyl-CoA synthetase beta subunit
VAAAHARDSARTLHELEAYALIDRLGIPRAPAVIVSADGSAVAPLHFGFPVAAKVLSEKIAHKTDAGGVALDIQDADALRHAIGAMRATIAERLPGVAVNRFLVQPMMSGIGEVLIGYRVDPDAGPLVLLAMGGVLAEIHQDRALRLAPVTLADAKAMIAEVRGLKALASYRGKPAGDLDALADALVALSQIAVRAPHVIEAEINPLIVRERGEGVVAVDALVRVA